MVDIPTRLRSKIMMSFDQKYRKNMKFCFDAESLAPSIQKTSKNLLAIRTAKSEIVNQLADQGISTSDRLSIVDLARKLEQNL